VSLITHKVRLIVRTAKHREALLGAINVSRLLYNAALEERSDAWTKSRLRISKNDQFKSITALRSDPLIEGLPVNLLRWPLVRAEDAVVHAAGLAIGSDVGTTRLATLSNGVRLYNLRSNRRLAPKMAAAQALACAKQGSKRRLRLKEKRLRLRQYEANCRATYLHQQSAALTRD
jgi:transposase